MAAPSTRLNCPPSDDLKAEIIWRFWQKPKSETYLGDYISYFQFYQKTCDALYLGIRTEAKSLVTDSHEHLLSIVDVLWSYVKDNQDCARLSLRKRLQRRFDYVQESDLDLERDAKLNNSINLALRLWLTMDIREDLYAPATASIQWDDNSTLQEFIKRQFPGPRFSTLLAENDRLIFLESDFTAVNLRRIGGIDIAWTCHLNEHLSFDQKIRKLKVYTLKSCLCDQKNSRVAIIPTAVIDETILSLQLLFPDWDPQTSTFLNKMNQTSLVEDQEYLKRLHLSDFHFWRDRLSEIYFEYQSPPSKWRQIWIDRRNRLQWYTFWLAIAIFILTIIFGLISSVTACMQTIYAYEALKLAREAAATPS